MISGITIAKNMLAYGFPYDLAIRSFAEVCDEIIVVIPKNDKDTFDALHKLMAEMKDRCEIKIRGVQNPDNFDVFRFIGYMWTSQPDWVVHFDLDYLISPGEGMKLREVINKTPANVDALSYDLVYLSKNVKRVVFNSDMKKWVCPYDGITGRYPLVVNPRNQIFISPFEGISENNRYINFGNSLFFRL